MIRYAFYLLLFLATLTTSPTWAADPFAGINLEQPLEITSERLEVFQNEQKTVFSGQVEAIQGDFQLNTDRLTVYYDEQQRLVDRLEAEGRVKVVQQDRSAQADRAVFKQQEQVLILTGHAILTQGTNRVAGEEIVFDLANNSSTVKSSGSGRVKATIMPPAKGDAK